MDPLLQIKNELADQIDRTPKTSNLAEIKADPWVVSSLLQKSIRRGEAEVAQRAARTLFALKGSAIWRRFMVIGFEDVGAGSTDALCKTVAASSDAAWRRQAGGDQHVASHIAALLAKAPKDRSTDYLICGTEHHPSLADARRWCGAAPAADLLNLLSETTTPLTRRALAAWMLVAGEGRGGIATAPDRVSDLMQVFLQSGVPEALLAATTTALSRTREPITVMAPLVWLAANEGSVRTVADFPLPDTRTEGDVPLYALDKHTRLGRRAIQRFSLENGAVRSCLEAHVPASQRRGAACMAAFYVDAAPVARRLMWTQSEQLEAFGTENDFLVAGVPAQGMAPLLAVFRENLDHLNAVRADVLRRVQVSTLRELPQ